MSLSRNAIGRELQRDGPVTEKLLSPRRVPCHKENTYAAYVFCLWHTSRHQQIAVIGCRCRSRADNLQPGTVEAGRVTPCTYTRTAILKSICCRIGNQCSSRRTGVISCRLLVRMISRAAAFCTDWCD